MYRKYVLFAFLFALAGCLSQQKEGPPPVAQGAALPPAIEAEKPSGPEDPEESPAAEPEPVDVTWFQGVDELPSEHPCHDSTSVLWVNEQGPAEMFSRRKLGELRANADLDYVHFGPRTVRGVRWKTGERHFLVVSCTMGGAGFREYDGRFEDRGHPSESATFSITYGGEPNLVEMGDLRWMHRDADGSWHTTHREDVWTALYMGTEPAIARGEVVSAEDLDSDGLVEVTAFTIKDCQGRTKICPKNSNLSGTQRPFVVTVIAREGTDQRREKVLLRHDAKVLSVERDERPQSMTDEVFEALESRLDRDRDKAVEKAIAILREENKLR